MKKIEVNTVQCEAIGKILQELSIKRTASERAFITFKADPETKLRAYLLTVAICHQTHTLINKPLNLVGFNYLEKVFMDLAIADSEMLDPAFLLQQTGQELPTKLGKLFSDTGALKDTTLNRLMERSDLIIDMSRKLVENHSGSISMLLSKSNGYLDRNDGIYSLLSDFNAYSDPLRKKSTLFVTLALNAGLLEIKDLENLVPIMDYHIQRVLLRLGCVEVLDPSLKHALMHQEKVDSDEEIRYASIEAVKLLALHSGHPLMSIHDFLWPLGRSCCKENPLCKSGVCDKNPCTFDLFVQLPSHKKCVFEGTCKGSLSQEYIKLWQPLVDTHYY
jgi:hypothetical protein